MQLVFATHNAHKLNEVQTMLPKQIRLLSLDAIGCHDEIPETGNTLEENAKIKALHVAKTYSYPCFADDTGLLVNALNGAPGVFSARYAGNHKDTEANIRKLLFELGSKKDRSARFETVITLALQGEMHVFKGVVSGTIIQEKRGTGGFGYDPVFVPDGYDKTFAELSPQVKNTISHRARATEKLVHFLSALNPS